MDFSVLPFWRHEDSAPNPLHLAIVAVASVALLYSRRLRGAGVASYVLSCVAGFVLLCLILKWQPWHTRLQLPLFLLAAPPVGAALAVVRPRWRIGLLSLLLVASLPWLVKNESRPLLARQNVLNTPRAEQYFANWRGLYPETRSAVQHLAAVGCSHVAVMLSWNDYEYPLWRLAAGEGLPALRLSHVNVRNVSAQLQHVARDRPPCALLARGHEAEAGALAAQSGMREVFRQDGLILFVP